MRRGRLISFPLEANSSISSFSGIVLMRFFKFSSLYFCPLVLKNFCKGKLLRVLHSVSSPTVGGVSTMCFDSISMS